MEDDNTFASLVAKLNAMGETGEPAKKRQEIKVIKKAKREGKKLHTDPNVNAMATLMESLGKPDVEEGKPNQLKGKNKLQSVPAGETDGTTKNPSKGKLVGEENTPIDEDLIASLKTQFRDLLEPKTVAEEEPTPEAVGEFAEPLYTLQDELGLEDNILVDELARWMDGQDITDFVKRFRQNHEMPEAGQSKRGHWPDDEKSEGVEEEKVAEGPDYRLQAQKETMNLSDQAILELIAGLYKKLDELGYKEETDAEYFTDLHKRHPNDDTDEGIVGAIGQGIDSAVAGGAKLAWKGAKKAAPHIKKGAKKLSKIGSKHTSYDVKTGKATTTLGMANG